MNRLFTVLLLQGAALFAQDKIDKNRHVRAILNPVAKSYSGLSDIELQVDLINDGPRNYENHESVERGRYVYVTLPGKVEVPCEIAPPGFIRDHVSAEGLIVLFAHSKFKVPPLSLTPYQCPKGISGVVHLRVEIKLDSAGGGRRKRISVFSNSIPVVIKPQE